MNRYERNFPAISPVEQELLASKRVLVAGCGGLGGYVLECLARAGVGRLTAADGDVFTETNLNRQLYSNGKTLGLPKPVAAAARLKLANPQVSVTPVCEYITEANAAGLTAGHDVVIDALDNGPARRLLARAAGINNIPLVSGAISGWRGRVFVLLPGENADFLWSGGEGLAAGNLVFAAAAAAAVQAAEAVKLLLGRRGLLHGRLLEFDLLSGEWEALPLTID